MGIFQRAHQIMQAKANKALDAAERPDEMLDLSYEQMLDQIRPEHLVLGLLSDPQSLAATAIVELGVSLATVRQAVTAVLPPPAGEVPALIPFDQQVRKVLELTFREALRLGHNYIGTEHILLALLELEDSGGVLSGLGLGKAAAQAHLAAALAAIQAAHQEQ